MRTFALTIIALCCISYADSKTLAFAQKGRDDIFLKSDYEKQEESIDKYYAHIRQGDRFLNGGESYRALSEYRQALSMATGPDGEVGARGALAEAYEKLGQYELALEQVDWFLNRNLLPRGQQKYDETKSRLLKKIEESKNQPRNDIVKKQLRSLTREQQGSLIKSFSDEDIEGLFKEVMQLEHSGNFVQALSKYEELLNHKEAIVAKFGVDAWVMLYPAIQRTAEAIDNIEKEHQALLWIEEYLLNPSGNYHDTLQKLEPQTVSHLKERAQKLLS